MSVFPERITDDKGSARIEGGISLRDYFAAACVQGILSNPETPGNSPYTTAREAYRVADALIQMGKSPDDNI